MNFHPASLKLTLPVFMVVATVLSAGAQQPPQQKAQPIIFSSAQGDDNTPSVPSLTPQAVEQPNLANEFQTPPAGLNFSFPSDTLPLPQMPAKTPAENQRLQKILEERRNWTLMTPAEILGVTTPEQIMGIREHDASGQEITPTPAERWLARQDQSQATNGLQNGAAAESWDFSSDRFNPDGTGRDNPRQFLDGFPNSAPNNSSGAPVGQNEGANWLKPSGAATQPKINLEQQAAVERFRQMLEPSQPATSQSGSDGKYFPTPTTTLNPNLGQTVLNPIGTPFTPLDSGIVKPQALSPLPGITAPNNPQPDVVPSWMPQPAPWLSQGPQLFAPPQRKF